MVNDSVVSIRKELESLQDELAGSRASCTILRTPYIVGKGKDAAKAQLLLERVLDALRSSVQIDGIAVHCPDFTATLTLDDGVLYDRLDYELCPAGSLVDRYLKRKLWHPDCPYPLDLGLTDTRPTATEIAEHTAAVKASMILPKR